MAEMNCTPCSVEGCLRKHKGRGYCAVHYKAFRKREIQNGAQKNVRPEPRKMAQCQHCGIEYKPKAFDRITFCSRQCSFDAKHSPKYSTVFAGFCKGCGGAFVSRRKKSYCGESCQPKTVWESIAPAEKTCSTCGKLFAPEFTGGGLGSFCGDECRDEARKKTMRVARSKRKAVILGATVERVDPFVVFWRDKWKCKLCGCKTPPNKRGTYADNAPELDHILPLAKGGEHSYRNTQCSCRKCNGLKSDTPRGQALLFG